MRAQADRLFRMAKVMAAGGFPEEAMPLLAKAIGHGGAAKLAALGELAPEATQATCDQIKDLVERKALPEAVFATLEEVSAPPPASTAGDVERHLLATSSVLAA